MITARAIDTASPSPRDHHTRGRSGSESTPSPSSSVTGRSLILRCVHKFIAVVLSSRVPGPTVVDVHTDDFLNLSTARIASIERDIQTVVRNRDDVTHVDIFVTNAQTQSHTLVERWLLHHEVQDLFNARALSQSQLVTPSSASRGDNVSVTKRMIVLVRALKSYLSLLPAGQLSRACQSYIDRHRTPPLSLSYHIHTSSSLQSSRTSSTFRGDVSSFVFGSLLTPKGKFHLTVHYQSSLREFELPPLTLMETPSLLLGMQDVVMEDYVNVRARANDSDRRSQPIDINTHRPPHRTQSQSPSAPFSHSLPPQHSGSRRYDNLSHSPLTPVTLHESPVFNLHHSQSLPTPLASSPPIAIPVNRQSQGPQPLRHSPHSHGYDRTASTPTTFTGRSALDRARTVSQPTAIAGSVRQPQSPVIKPSSASLTPHLSSISPDSPLTIHSRRRSSVGTPHSFGHSQPHTPHSFVLGPTVVPMHLHTNTAFTDTPPLGPFSLGSLSGQLSRESQLGSQLARIAAIKPLDACFTVSDEGEPRLKAVAIHELLAQVEAVIEPALAPSEPYQ